MSWDQSPTAARMKRIIETVVVKRINELRPAPRYGILQSIDATTDTAMVKFPGEAVAVPVSARTAPVLDVGAQVRVSGVPGARYVDEPLFLTGSEQPGGGGWSPPTNGGGWVTLKVATTNPAGPSNEDELEWADVTLNGATDDEVFTFVGGGGSSQTHTVRLLMGSGVYYMKAPVGVANGVNYIIESQVPTRRGRETVELQVGAGWVDDDPLFRYSDIAGSLMLHGIKVTQDSNSNARWKLSNTNHMQLERSNVSDAERIFYPAAGASHFVARDSLLSGTSLYALIRSGYGFDANNSTCLKFTLDDCEVSNSVGPTVNIDDCPDFWIGDNLLEAKGAFASIQLRHFLPPTVVRPPGYRQVVRNNRLITRPIIEGADPNEVPFLLLDNIRGALITDNLGMFLNWDSTLYTGVADGEFVILENHSDWNVLTGNLFVQATGLPWDQTNPINDGSLIAACIALDVTCSNNSLSNPKQCIHDLGEDNEIGSTGGGGGAGTAAETSVADAGDYFDGVNVEEVLQELGETLTTVGTTTDEYIIHWSGPLVVSVDQSTTPDPQQIRRDCEINNIFLTLVEASPDETSSVAVFLDGVIQGTAIAIGTLEDTLNLAIEPPIDALAGQRLQLKVITAGAGASGLVAQIHAAAVGGNVGPIGATGRDAMGLTGWIESGDTWNRTGLQTATCSGVDIAALVSGGARLRWKQGGTYRYGYARSVSGSTLTKFTTTSANDFAAIAGSVTDITDFAYSFEEHPLGFPGAFDFTSTVTGIQSITTVSMRFKVSGRLVTWWFKVPGSSGAASGVNTFLATAPVPISASDTESYNLLSALNGISYGIAHATISGSTCTLGFNGPFVASPLSNNWISTVGQTYKVAHGVIHYEW